MSINYLELILTFFNAFVTFPAGSRERKGVHGVLHFVHHVHDWHHDHCYSFALQLRPRSPGIAESRYSIIAKRSACLFSNQGKLKSNQFSSLLSQFCDFYRKALTFLRLLVPGIIRNLLHHRQDLNIITRLKKL